MIIWSPLRQKLQFFCDNYDKKAISLVTTLLILSAVFLTYCYSISYNHFFLGQHYDYSARFIIAMQYAHDPSKIFNLESWLSVWPPIPFIIQGFVLRLAFLFGMSDASTGIMAVQLTGVLLVLCGFYFIGRSVALQTDEFTGVFAFLMCFCASILMYIAATTAAEVYTFFFVSLAIWNFFRFISKNKGLGWLVLSFALAFFCRSESLLLAFLAGALLVGQHYWRPAALLVGTQSALLLSKFLGAILLVDGIKFFEYGELYNFGETWQAHLKTALLFPYSLLKYNKGLIVLSCVCIFPLIYYVVKAARYKNSLKGAPVRHNWNSDSKNSTVIHGRMRAIVWLTRTYRQVCFWILSVPVVFWSAFFLAAIVPLLGEALRGNIDYQWRYLFMANVFMTVIIALLAVQSTRTLYIRDEKLAKKAALGIVSVLVLFSLWSGFTHATGQKILIKMLPSDWEVIHFIRDHRVQGDRVAFDTLPQSKHIHFAAYLLDPSLTIPTQYGLTWLIASQERDSEITSLLPEKFQFNRPPFSVQGRTTLFHAFIHGKNPRFLVLASDKQYEFMRIKEQKSPPDLLGWGSNFIREYLSPMKGMKSTFVFQSPYILPEVKIPFTKVHENKDFIILEQLERPNV